MKKKRKRITADNIKRPKKFTLRSYNIFISQFIQKDNYGWYNHGEGQRFRYGKDQIRGWRQSKNKLDWDRARLKENEKVCEYDTIYNYERINDSFQSHL